MPIGLVSRPLAWLSWLALVLATLPSLAFAQGTSPRTGVNPNIGGSDITPPAIYFDPITGTVHTLSPSVTITFCDNKNLLANSRQIVFDGTNVTSSFSYVTSTVPGCTAAAKSTGTISLHSGRSDTLSAFILDQALNTGRGTAIYTYSPPPAPAIAVGPDSMPSNVATNSTGLTATFTVTNTGNASGSFTFSTTSCSAPVISCGTPSPSSATIAAGSSKTVTVSYSTNGTASTGGLIRLHGAVGSLQDDGSVVVSTYIEPPLQTTAVVGPGTERDQCLSFSVGAGAATECGDLRLVVPLPAVQSLDRTRAPTLIYNSQLAHPYPVVPIAVTVPAGQALPTTVKATLRINGAARDSGTWNGSDWGAPGGTRQITLGYDALTDSTNVYAYTVQVVGITSGVQTTIDTLSGHLVVVNRSLSSFGAGWWLAGLDQLIAQPDSAFLFVGGDGSARVYMPVPGQPTEWTAPQADHRDLLQLISGEYVQALPGGLRVHFDAAGRHTSTVNRLGHVTTFAYDATCHQLSTITTPIGALAYTFAYTTFGTPPCGNRRLASVTAPPIGAQTRVVALTPASTGQVTQIADVDGSTVHFGYGATWPTRIISRTNELGKVVTFAYDAAALVHQVRDSMDTAPAIVTTYTNAATLGFHGTAAVDTAQVYTLANGPRTDTTITKFWLDRFGAPRKIVNALGQATTLARGDARWPALVTRLVAVNGLVTTAGYDDHGSVVADTIWNPLGDGQNAVATYTWDGKWDFATSSTSPAGQTTSAAYDGITGNTVWSAFGGDTTRFAYTSNGLLRTVTTSDDAQDTYTYDATLGNLASHSAPLSGTATMFADAIGRDTLTLTPSAATDTLKVRTLYNKVGADTLVVSYGSHDSLTVRTRYDATGRDTSVTQHAYPDLNSVGDVTRSFSYDPIGRKVRERLHGSIVFTWTWDPAGNLLWGGQEWGSSTTYDALNRPIARAKESGMLASILRFAYDSAGNLRSAAGPYGYTARTYYPNGLVATDTQKISTVADTGSFSQHVYAIGYHYDLGGRRSSLTVPSQLGGGTIHYTYDSRTGQLATVTEPGGAVFRYHYDRQARLDSLLRRDGLSNVIREARTYDSASRLATLRIWTPTATMLGDTVTYDLRGHAISVGTEHGRDAISYDRRGWVSTSDVFSRQQYFSLDAMENRATTLSVNGVGDSRVTDFYEHGTARLVRESASSEAAGDTTVNELDEMGNLLYGHHNLYFGVWIDPTGGQNNWMRLDYETVNSYDGSNRMIYHSMTFDTVAQFYVQRAPHYTATETYQYDPLGRRIRYRSIKGDFCYLAEPTSGCHSTLTRVIWDGNQILGEIRANGSASASPSDLENDAPIWVGPNYGAVLYVYGPDLDVPLEIIKNQADTVLPMTDYRGAMVTGTCPASPCQTTELVFAQSSEGIFGDVPYWNGMPSWYGTLIDGQTDASGYIYRRNRYLDPATGRFTQEDPLGLAGGLNAYGYANGDPITYSDPFGTCPMPPWDCPPGFWTVVGGITGFLAGGGTGAGAGAVAAAPTLELASPVLVPAFALGGAVEGAIAGARIGMALDAITLMAESNGGGSKRTGVNQINTQIRRGQAPKSVTRADVGKVQGEQDHIHFGEDNALNVDGTWKHGGRELTNAEKDWLTRNSWNLPR